MSYDVGIKLITTDNSDVYTDLSSHNYTSNVHEVFYDVIPGGIKALDGLTTGEAKPLLEAALVKIEQNRAEYHEMLKNLTWGNLEGAENFLRKILLSCIEVTEVRITVSA